MSARRRLENVSGHLAAQTTSPALAKVLEKHPDDVVITAAIRTPITKSRVGLFKDTPSEELIVHVLKAIREQSNIDPGVVEEICVGNTLTPAPAYGARSAALSAGFPNTTAVHVVSRFCSTGLLSVQTTATAIATGVIDVGIAVGVESMSRNSDKPPSVSAKVLTTQEAKDVLQPMVWTAEQVSRRFNVSREEQDKFAVYSQHQAEKAFKEGWTQDEIAPVTTQWVDAKTGGKKIITVSKDETPRHGTTYEALAKIKSATPQWGNTTTGGNASKLADGAAALLLMKRSTAERLGQKILGKYVQSTSVGVEPAIMGISPIYAIPKVLKKTGLTKEDVDIFEINEAFASMFVHCVKDLGLELEKVNVRGGAIAIGHPMSCTGVRQIVTALSELRRRKAKVTVTSMCVGTGMGMAAVFVNEA